MINKLLHWYAIHKRDLPWRSTSDPYKIWISEVILQQTRISQGLPYYLRFVESYPTVKDLAMADEQDVLKLWQGLGYYSRARNMHKAAKQVLDMFNGVFPCKFDALMQLQGVGPYTAAAVSSISSNEAVAAVDGNVQRVISRLFEIEDPVNESKGKKEIDRLANELLDSGNASDYNQAMMELGALICSPKSPKCLECPLQYSCLAFKKGRTAELPIKRKKVKVRKRYFYYFLAEKEGELIVQKRTAKDIWQNMYEFLSVDSDERLEGDEALRGFTEKYEVNSDFDVRKVSFVEKHVLSHQILQATLYKINCNATIFESLSAKANVERVKNVEEVPVSRLVSLLMERM